MAALILACGGSSSSSPSAPSTVTPTPTVTGPVAESATSYPFLSQTYPAPVTTNGTTLSANGYVEDEYFYSGTANVYTWDSTGTVKAPYSGPYTNRMIIFRPSDTTKFSGKVMLELLNSTSNSDQAPIWNMVSDVLMKNGDIFVGISSKPVAIASLKTFNATRYAPLSWANPVPATLRSSTPGWGYAPEASKPETQDGLVWDALSQAGTLLKTPTAPNPLSAYSIQKVYVGGQSQSGCLIQTYINAIQSRATLKSGAPVFDGYLQVVGSAVYQINQDDQDDVNETGDPLLVTFSPVPQMRILSQSDFSNFGLVNSLPGRRQDSDSPTNKFRLVEVPGANHGGDTIPLKYIVRGGYHNLDKWVTNGTKPPYADRIIVDTSITDFQYNAVLDTHGNALGGLRTPWLDVPIATYVPHNPDLVPMFYPFLGSVSYIIAWASGTTTYFDAATNASLYGTRENYLSRFNAKTDQLVSGAWISAEDAAAIKAAAAADTAHPAFP